MDDYPKYLGRVFAWLAAAIVLPLIITGITTSIPWQQVLGAAALLSAVCLWRAWRAWRGGRRRWLA